MKSLGFHLLFAAALPMWVACTPEAGATFDGPNFLVADLEGASILEVGPEGAEPLIDAEAVAPQLRGDFRPSAVALHDHTLWISNFSYGEVLRVDLERTVTEAVTERSAKQHNAWLEEPASIQVHDGQLWVLGNDSRNVVMFGDDGDIIGEFGGTLGAPPIRNGHGIAVSDEGLAYVATSVTTRNLGLVQVWDPSTGQRLAHGMPYGELENATALSFDDHGNLWIADWVRGELVRTDDAVSGVDLRVSGFEHPVSMTRAEGLLWVLDDTGIHAMDPESGQHWLVYPQQWTWARNLWVMP